ncbi:hypothetical protein ABT173_09030 [Streptomyces sp. NPDC001795]|uniref:hypothetical protein n=1 Tax=unclassified Streptomyces TaxID=2593676 RepID=UPI0033248B0E
MVRGTTVRFVLTILSAVLLALQLFAPTASFASAHRTQVTAAASPEAVTSKRADEVDETVTCGDIEHLGGPTGPLRTRDRHRSAADSVPEPPALVLLAHDGTAARPPARPASLRISRSSTAHTPAALQVFRR